MQPGNFAQRQQQSANAQNTPNSSSTDLREVMRFKHPCSSVQELLLAPWAPIARYVKLYLGQIGISLTLFSAHSPRRTST